MSEQKITLLRYVRTQQGWARRKVPTGGSRGWEQRLDQDTRPYGLDVLDLGEYQIRWYENRKGESRVCYLGGGSTYSGARTALAEQRDKLDLLRAAGRLGIEVPPQGQGQPLKFRLEPFLKDRMATKKITSEDTCRIYRNAVGAFLEATGVTFVEQIKAETLADYLTKLQQRGLSDQSQLNYYAALGAFLRAQDERLGKLIRQYTPRVRKKKPVSYTREEMEALLAYLRNHPSEQRIALAAETFWKTGLRASELSHLTWDMVDLKRGLITIRDDRQFRLQVRGQEKNVTFRTKTRRDRELRIPVEAALLDRLRQWRENHPRDRFLFPTTQGNPDHHVLLRVKIAAHRAGLSCGQCEHCRNPCGECKHCKCGKCQRCRTSRRCIHPHHGDQPCTRIQCEKWKLHRLRHTFATTAVRKGADLAMLMNLLGHSKLSTTQVYISAAKEAEAQVTVNAMFGD